VFVKKNVSKETVQNIGPYSKSQLELNSTPTWTRSWTRRKIGIL